MLRLRRPTTVLLTALLPASLALAACGSDDSMLEGFDAVSVDGPVGEAPEIDWKGTLAPGKAQAKVIEEGDGEEIADGDVVRIDYTLANGYTEEVNYSTYADPDSKDGKDYNVGTLVKVGADEEPQSIADLLTKAVRDEIEAGQRIGTRIAVTVGSDKLLGDFLGNQQVSQFLVDNNIGNEDGLLFVADLTALAGPDGTETAAPSWAPKLVEKDGVPSGFDFTGTPKPSTDLRVATLVKGKGPVVKSGQKILASYLGQVPSGKEPFDESYSGGTGLEAVVGGAQASVVEGWSKGLVGLPVGSRVLLQIPPALGYGKEAQKDQDGKVTIPASSTLYFVVDILDVSDVEPAPKPDPAPAPSDPAPESPAGTPSSSPSSSPSSTPSE